MARWPGCSWEAWYKGVDYAYTLQGWLKGVNGNFLNASTDMSQDGKAAGVAPFGDFNRDVFAFSLDYFQNDYAPIGVSLPQPANAFSLTYLLLSSMRPHPAERIFTTAI